MSNYRIEKYSEKFRPQILSIWEKSVRETHTFLSQPDFIEIKKSVAAIDFNVFQVFCLIDQDLVLGFIGVAENKIEMLFMDPSYIGKGLGRKLLSFAVNELEADKVDVNEQNLKALDFYLKFGFKIVERTDKDDQGRNYPILRMSL